MTALVHAANLRKSFGAVHALDGLTFDIEAGRIVGLIGPNGAGKTTALRAILGMCDFAGELSVLGRDPRSARAEILRDACFIADVAILPGWLTVRQACDFVGGVHPKFRRERAEGLIQRAQIDPKRRIRELSKGMKTQVHLALTVAIDARLLILDEPTLGLDLLARRAFYDALVNDYMDETRTILLTTHQVEEVENLLTDVLFLDKGKIVLDASLDDLATKFAAVAVKPDSVEAARALSPFYERKLLGRSVFYFDKPDFEALESLGELHAPTVSDLFVAKLSQGRSA
jgi:ABC-2 type transport system ATP-binding protein